MYTSLSSPSPRSELHLCRTSCWRRPSDEVVSLTLTGDNNRPSNPCLGPDQLDIKMTLSILYTCTRLALESIQRGQFSCESDVWSFGVLAWEILNWGKEPYDDIPEMQLHTALLQMLNRGKRLALPPETVGQDVEEIINQCWDREPTRRPNFPALLHFFSTKAMDYPSYLSSLAKLSTHRKPRKTKIHIILF